MARVMEGMQESQAQQLQLMTQLNSFTRYMDTRNLQKEWTKDKCNEHLDNGFVTV